MRAPASATHVHICTRAGSHDMYTEARTAPREPQIHGDGPTTTIATASQDIEFATRERTSPRPRRSSRRNPS